MIGFGPEEIGNLINLPKDYVICIMIAVEKAVKEAQPRGGQLALGDVMITDHF